MFGSVRNSVSPYFTGAGDGPDFWDQLDQRRAEHQRRAVWIGIVIGLLALSATVVHVNMLILALVLLPFLFIELVMIRTSRSRAKIPDYRPQPPIKIELDDR